MYNPRWPHKLRSYKAALNSRGLPELDENGEPMMVAVVFKRVVYDSKNNPSFHADGTFVTEDVTDLPWGYRTATGGIKDSGEVFASDFKISCPMVLTRLEEGDVLKLTDYQRTFDAVVKKCTTYNWGTNIWLDRPGNNGEV